MNEKEIYGAKVSVDTTEAKNKFKQLAEFIRNFGKQAEEDATVMPKLVNTGYEKQIEYVKSQMYEIQDLLNRADAGEEIGKDVLKLESDYETLSYKLEDLIEKQKEFNGELDDTGKESSKMKTTLSDMFDHSIGKIKRFTYYLLGARSIFSLFRKYQSIYFQYNEQMQYQTELSQNAIALSLAPAFEFLGNAIAYASIGFAKFIELLTGVNVLSKVNTKGIRDYNKSLKESRTLLNGLDEITNLDASKGVGTGLAEQYKALDDFRKKIKEVDEWLEKTGIKKFITEKLVPAVKKVFDWLGKIFEFTKKHWDVLKYALGAVAIGTIALKIATSLSGLSGVLGTATGVSVGTGLAGLSSVISSLATIGAIMIAISIVIAEFSLLGDLIDKLKEVYGYKKKLQDWNFTKLQEMPDILDVVIGRLKKTKKGTEDWDLQASNVKEEIKATVGFIRNGKVEYGKYKPIVEELRKKLEDLDDETFSPELEILTALEGNTANDTLLLHYLKTGNANINLSAKATWSGDSNAKDFLNGNKTFTVNGKVNLDTGKAKEKIKTLIDIFEKGGKQGMFTKIVTAPLKALLTKLSVGTNYVPYDNFPALLHKGEAVVPAKYNPAVNNTSNDYTNSLLETLIIKIDDLSKRPNVFEIDGQKFAKATYSLYDEEYSNQNYVKGVVR